MKKIYGYDEREIIRFSTLIKSKQEGLPLSAMFAEFAASCGKSKGTIRNMYYDLAKKAAADKDFCRKYFGKEPPRVTPINEFDDAEEKRLIKSVLIGKKSGRSVRSVILELAGNDGKTALRYQNKFRNAVKSKPRLIAETVAEIRRESGSAYDFVPRSNDIKTVVSDIQLRRLKNEINSLCERISVKLRRENEFLKNKLSETETENIRLKNILYGNSNVAEAVRFLKSKSDKNIIN